MCTPALRELKRKNPTTFVRFYTDFPAIVRGLPYIDEVLPYGERPEGVIDLRYEDAIPPLVHIAKILGDNLGIDVHDVRPDCIIDRGLSEGFRKSWSQLPRPYVVVQRRASRWTPNKDWPNAYWLELISQLSQRAGVIEVGNIVEENAAWPTNYVDLRNQTSLEELVAVVAAADVFVGPPSGPQHIAAAAGTPAAIIIGGYEHPKNSYYVGNVCFYQAVSCAPCWLTEPCPYNLKCLEKIRPSAVEAAVWSLWANRKEKATVPGGVSFRSSGIPSRG